MSFFRNIFILLTLLFILGSCQFYKTQEETILEKYEIKQDDKEGNNRNEENESPEESSTTAVHTNIDIENALVEQDKEINENKEILVKEAIPDTKKTDKQKLSSPLQKEHNEEMKQKIEENMKVSSWAILSDSPHEITQIKTRQFLTSKQKILSFWVPKEGGERKAWSYKEGDLVDEHNYTKVPIGIPITAPVISSDHYFGYVKPGYIYDENTQLDYQNAKIGQTNLTFTEEDNKYEESLQQYPNQTDEEEKKHMEYFKDPEMRKEIQKVVYDFIIKNNIELWDTLDIGWSYDFVDEQFLIVFHRIIPLETNNFKRPIIQKKVKMGRIYLYANEMYTIQKDGTNNATFDYYIQNEELDGKLILEFTDKDNPNHGYYKYVNGRWDQLKLFEKYHKIYIKDEVDSKDSPLKYYMSDKKTLNGFYKNKEGKYILKYKGKIIEFDKYYGIINVRYF